MILCKIRRLIYSNEADLTVVCGWHWPPWIKPVKRIICVPRQFVWKEDIVLDRTRGYMPEDWGLTFSPNLFIRIFAKTRCRDSEAPYSLQMLKSFQLTQSRHAQSKVLLAIRDLIQWWLIVSSPWFCPILIRGLRSRGSVFCVSEGTDSNNAWTVGRITWNFMLEETQDDFGTIHFRGPVFRAPSFSSFSSQLGPIQY